LNSEKIYSGITRGKEYGPVIYKLWFSTTVKPVLRGHLWDKEKVDF
jgi:hypothetical protein